MLKNNLKVEVERVLGLIVCINLFYIYIFYFMDENKEFNLENYIDWFVYTNWKLLDYSIQIEDIEIEIEDEEENTEEELFYKDIVYNEY